MDLFGETKKANAVPKIGLVHHSLPSAKRPAVTGYEEISIPVSILAKQAPGIQECVHSLVIVVADGADEDNDRPVVRLFKTCSRGEALTGEWRNPIRFSS